MIDHAVNQIEFFFNQIIVGYRVEKSYVDKLVARNPLHFSLLSTSFTEHIRILHECQIWIDKSVPRVTFWHHEARRVMPNCDPRGRFVYPYLTRMMDSFSCSLAANIDFYTIYLEK